MLVNSDRFLLLSNQRDYFIDKKNYFIYEMNRLTNLYEKAYYKKRKYKKNVKELNIQKEDLIIKFEGEINSLKKNLFLDCKEIYVQTDINLESFKEIQKNNDIVVFHKKLVS